MPKHLIETLDFKFQKINLDGLTPPPPHPAPNKKNTNEELDFKFKLNSLPQNETLFWRTLDRDKICFSPR